MSHPTVAISRQDYYETSSIKEALHAQFIALGISPDLFRGKRVVIKPNLLLGYAPERATTTHPSVVEAAALLAKEWGAADVLLAESPGGPYRKEILASIYRSCGMTEPAARGAYRLNEDLSARDVHAPNGVASKMFHLLTPICDADLILNLCKLKTHALAQMTCAVKNLFGTIPGIEKFEMHARFREINEFFHMLIDLCEAIRGICPVISIVDAIEAMEGDGPSGGDPRHLGAILSSCDPYALDLACAAIIGMEDSVPMLSIAKQRSLCPAHADEIDYPLLPPSALAVPDFRPAQTNLKSKFDLIPKFMQPRPIIDPKICVGCGKCIASCPASAMEKRNGVAYIRKNDCIRCYCCQELCTLEAVHIVQHWLIRLLQPRR